MLRTATFYARIGIMSVFVLASGHYLWGSPSASDPRAKNTGQRATKGTVLMSQRLSPWCDCRRLGSTWASWRWQDINVGNPLWRRALLSTWFVCFGVVPSQSLCMVPCQPSDLVLYLTLYITINTQHAHKILCEVTTGMSGRYHPHCDLRCNYHPIYCTSA